jgi:hypothetical protein
MTEEYRHPSFAPVFRRNRQKASNPYLSIRPTKALFQGRLNRGMPIRILRKVVRESENRVSGEWHSLKAINEQKKLKQEGLMR